MPFSGPREDREAIRELYARYSDASACADVTTFLGCFAEDAEWLTHVFEKRGKAAIKAQWDELWLGFESAGFLTEIGSIEVDGDTASCRCVAREIVRLKSGGLFKLIGRYTDRLVRDQNGEWLFLRRSYEPIAEEVQA